MATPLTDGINALIRYANEVTGSTTDATLSDAVESLVAGYGGGGSSLWKTITLDEDISLGVPALMEYLGIPEQDILSGSTFHCAFVGNENTSLYCARFATYKIFDGYPGEVRCLAIRRTDYSNAIFGFATSTAMRATAGTVIKIYKL